MSIWSRMLLDAHADANSANQDGETALMLASEHRLARRSRSC